MMSAHRKGYCRDNAILNAIEKFKVLDTDQIYAMFFSDIKNGKRIAQRRLRALYQSQRVNRSRLSMCLPCHYFIGKKPGQVEHTLACNWVYLRHLKQIKSWEQITEFSRENDYKILRSDGFIGIKNTISNKYRFSFIEVDLSENTFDKIQKYNMLYESGKYLSAYWVKYSERFPSILIGTNRVNRLKEIHRCIDQYNLNGLEFKVMTLEKIKLEVMSYANHSNSVDRVINSNDSKC